MSSPVEAWLWEHYGAERFEPGLERVRSFLRSELAEVKKLQQQGLKLVTIAGTNGKGETAYALLEHARQTGTPALLWTSPHITSVTERLQHTAGLIPEAELQELLDGVRCDHLAAGIGLSYYEVLWVAFLRWGLRQKARVWILEVGLGGRLDAVNLLDAQLVGLCSISRDHQEYLGPRLDGILQEKLGVLRPGATLISALESRYLREHCGRTARKFAVVWHDLFESKTLAPATDFSARNRFLAAALWETLSGTAVAPIQGALIARGERFDWQGKEYVFFGSHNPDGVRKLVQFLCSPPYNIKEELTAIWASFSQRDLKDLHAMIKSLELLATDESPLVITQFDHPKAASFGEFWGYREGARVRYVQAWRKLFEEAGPATGTILVVGSYYFVALLRAHLLHLGARPARPKPPVR